MKKEYEMDDKLNLAIATIFDSLTTVWENNGNILAEAVRDSVITNLSRITQKDFEEIEKIVEDKIMAAQS